MKKHNGKKAAVKKVSENNEKYKRNNAPTLPRLTNICMLKALGRGVRVAKQKTSLRNIQYKFDPALIVKTTVASGKQNLISFHSF